MRVTLFGRSTDQPLVPRRADPDGMRKWPVDAIYNGASRRHEDNYEASRPGGRKHGGVDINLGSGDDDLGAPIYATHDGQVTGVTKYNQGSNAGGNRVEITASDGSLSTSYIHLNSINSGITVGTPIAEGQKLGTMGGSGYGNTTAFKSHLHYEVSLNGTRIDPTNGPKDLIDPMTLINPEINIRIW